MQIDGKIGGDNGITDPEGIGEKITQCKGDKDVRPVVSLMNERKRPL